MELIVDIEEERIEARSAFGDIRAILRTIREDELQSVASLISLNRKIRKQAHTILSESASVERHLLKKIKIKQVKSRNE